MTEPRPRRAVDQHDDSGAYVLDAMGPQERRAFEAHLRECAVCQRNVREFRETLSGMKELVGQPPPPTLRDTILATIRNVPQLPPNRDQDKPEDRN
jgi:anti-sigma factor RsiW